jgi:hypothetical protein
MIRTIRTSKRKINMTRKRKLRRCHEGGREDNKILA